MKYFSNCNYCNELIIHNEFKVDKKTYKKAIFIVYDKFKKTYCSLMCKINKERG